ncbi:MAG: succinate dehydrogenase, hydrophobic membrane anchor protein [Hyphomicrobiales bacterium]
MIASGSQIRTDAGVFRLLEMIPPLARYARSRGLPFIISWSHRLSGVLLVMFIWFHIYTLSFLSVPGAYTDKMRLYALPAMAFIEWALAIPVIFHALNGGRLILYESFHFRKDDLVLTWVVGLSFLYTVILAGLMLMGNQSVSAVFFWFVALPAALTLAYGLYARLRRTPHQWGWKLQRITGAFLLVAVPAHFLFMHLNPHAAKDAGEVVRRMQDPWIKVVDVVLVACALYHGGYGLKSILSDYVASKKTQAVGTAAIVAAMMLAAWVGLRLVASI